MRWVSAFRSVVPHLLVWLIAVLIAASFERSAFASDETRELQRKLWVLGLSDEELDGKDSRALRDSLARFMSEHGKNFTTENDAAGVLDQAIKDKIHEAIGPYESTQPFDRPSFSKDIISNLEISPEDNIVLAGDCQNIARFRLDTGMPLKSFMQTTGQHFTYSSATKKIICFASWAGTNNGLHVIDSVSGISADYIRIPGLASFTFAKITAASASSVIWVLADDGVWSVDLARRDVRELDRITQKIMPGKLFVSSDGSIIAVQFLDLGKKREEIRVYDTSSGRRLTSGTEYDWFQLSDSGNYYYIRTSKSAEIHDSRSGNVVFTNRFENGEGPFDAVAFTSDDKSLLFVNNSDDVSSVFQWDFATGDVRNISHFPSTGTELQIDERRGEIYTVGSDGVSRYRLMTGEALIPRTAVRRLALDAAAVSLDGSVAIGIAGTVAYVLDTQTGQMRTLHFEACNVSGSEEITDAVELADFIGNEHIAIACDDGSIKELDLTNGKVRPITNFSKEQAKDIRVSPDGRYVAARYSEYSPKSKHTLLVAEAATGKIVVQKTSSDWLTAFNFVDGGSSLLYGLDHFAIVQNLSTGRIVSRQELRLETTRSGNRTRWYWGVVKWVIPDTRTDAALLGVGGSGGLIYKYESGKFTLLAGQLTAGKKSADTIARASRASRLGGNRLVSLVGPNEPITEVVGADDFSSQHDVTGGRILALAPQKEGRFLAITDVGDFLLYDVDKPQPILRTVLSENGNWLSRIDGGYFGGTREAAQNLFLAPSLNETVTIDSFFNTLYRPDLVAAVASGSRGAQKEDDGPTINTLLKDGLPPTIKILSPAGESIADKDTIVAKATVTASTGGIGRIEWRVNGIARVARTLPPSVKVNQGEPIAIDDSLLLEPGNNVIELIVFNASNGIASTPATTNVSWAATGTSVSPRLFVLAVGINEYWDSRLTLKFAANDAADLTHSFELAGADLFDGVKTWLVTDKKATRNGIDAAFDGIAKQIRSTDVFVLFVAGHGKTEDGRYYFIPYDFKYSGPSSVSEQGINQDDWQRWLTRVATRKSLLMFDTCESGTLTLERTTRGFDRLAALDRLTRATGRSVLAASSDDGPALEGFQGHGVFAYSVMEGLGVADPNRTGLIQVTALASYVGARVPDLSFGKFGIRQVPQMKLIGEDFAVGRTVNALANPSEDFVPIQPTHVVIAVAPITDAKGVTIGEPLHPGTLVRVVGTAAAKSEVARDGKRIGFVSSTTLAPMQ
ncbi:caspase family protein [Mesorhizobium shangrilense]|uniref:Caspase family protein n=1 Tax=Mesorhizobium shangrilense TaxID=460060 RepID=A0ABV2DN90_9HYPH